MDTNTEGQLSLFAAGSPASRSVSPGSEAARAMTAHYGRKCAESFAKFSQLGSLAKVFLGSSRWNSTTCYLTWKEKVTPHKRLYFQLAPSMPRTAEIGSGLLHTPTAKANQMSPSMNGRWPGSWWPTPTQDSASERTKKYAQGGTPLTLAVKMWPTPAACDYKGARTKEAMARSRRNPTTNSLRDSVEEQSGYATPPGQLAGSLNPEWVEWLMGFPIGWTDCER